MYKFLEHTADLEVLVEADTFEELVAEAIRAVTEAVAGNVKLEERKEIEIEGKSEEEMLMKALEEIVFLQSLGFYVGEVKVRREREKIKIEMRGGKGKVRDEIKAITWHEFWVKKNDKWKAHFICDL